MKGTFLFFLFVALWGHAQSGKLLYEVDMDRFIENVDREKYPEKKLSYLRQINKAMVNLNLELRFDRNLSSFAIVKTLSAKDNGPMHNLANTFSCKGTYFTDLEKKVQLLQTGVDGKKVNVESKISKVNWKITGETKDILGYLCKKAVTTKKVPKGNVDIIAWYCPDLKQNFGPTEYSGTLPGLIMQLDDLLVSYTCTNIVLDPKKSFTVKWPENVKALTNQEYKKRGDKVYESLKKTN